MPQSGKGLKSARPTVAKDTPYPLATVAASDCGVRKTTVEIAVVRLEVRLSDGIRAANVGAESLTNSPSPIANGGLAAYPSFNPMDSSAGRSQSCEYLIQSG